MRQLLARLGKSEFAAILLVIAAAALLRFPGLAEPRVAIFDEPIYANFAVQTLDGIPYFDIHPPFVKMLFARTIAGETFDTRFITMEPFTPLRDFPYVRVRAMVALFGIALISATYAIARGLGAPKGFAIASAALVAFDNGLVVYSRAMLPDMIILALEFSALALAIAATRSQHASRAYLLALTGAVLIGLAVASKWTALGLLGAMGLVYVWKRRFAFAATTLLVVPLVYIGVFLAFFASFPSGGPMQQILPHVDAPGVRTIVFPTSLSGALAILPEFHAGMSTVNADPNFLAHTLEAPGAASWPFARNPMIFWKDDPTRASIVFWGNPYAWIVVFALALALLLALAAERLLALGTRAVQTIDERTTTALFLLACFAGNYAPFLLIDRPMYPYHYLPALLFLYLLAPFAIAKLREVSEREIGPVFTRRVFLTLLVPIPFIFLMLIPQTYGPVMFSSML